jgi:putative tricarboxylic transport membrane protein
MPRVVAAGPVLGIVLAGVLFVETRGFDALAREGQLGPGFWPRLVLGGLVLGCIAKLVQDWRRAHGASARLEREEMSWLTLVGAIALIVLYVVGAGILGFVLATVQFVAAFMWVSGARAPVGIVLNAVVGTVVLIYAFVRLVYLPLPKGEGPFEALTLALYRTLGIF